MLILYLFAVILALAYYYLTYTFSHWKNKGIKSLKSYPVVGSMGSIITLKEHLSEFFYKAYHMYRDEPFTGYFQGRTPGLLVRDPELVKKIMIKDFTHFVDHGFVVDEDVDPLQARNLFNMEGQRWKEMRTKLTPTFTSGRIKSMFPLVMECAQNLEKVYGEFADSGTEIDIKDLLARYTTDVISTCAFGVQCDSLNDPKSPFRVMGRRMFDLDLIQGLKNITLFFLPEVGRRLRFRFFDDEITDFFRTMVRDVMALRKKTGETRNDFMQLLIQLKELGRLTPVEGDNTSGHQEDSNVSKLTDDDVTAQAMVFFLAGFETSSSALTFALFELSRQPDLQLRARQEIERVLQQHDGQLTYQALQDMKYLDWILQESLRKYPPVTVLNRECTKTYVIPDSNITIDKGTLICIPIHAMQNDSEFFPDPDTFLPERFDDDNQKNQSIYMPFGEGPRQCIGLRFARMQSKLGLVMLLRKFELEPSAKTPIKLTYDPRQFLLMSKEDVLIKVHRV